MRVSVKPKMDLRDLSPSFFAGATTPFSSAPMSRHASSTNPFSTALGALVAIGDELSAVDLDDATFVDRLQHLLGKPRRVLVVGDDAGAVAHLANDDAYLGDDHSALSPYHRNKVTFTTDHTEEASAVDAVILVATHALPSEPDVATFLGAYGSGTPVILTVSHRVSCNAPPKLQYYFRERLMLYHGVSPASASFLTVHTGSPATSWFIRRVLYAVDREELHRISYEAGTHGICTVAVTASLPERYLGASVESITEVAFMTPCTRVAKRMDTELRTVLWREEKVRDPDLSFEARLAWMATIATAALREIIEAVHRPFYEAGRLMGNELAVGARALTSDDPGWLHESMAVRCAEEAERLLRESVPISTASVDVCETDARSSTCLVSYVVDRTLFAAGQVFRCMAQLMKQAREHLVSTVQAQRQCLQATVASTGSCECDRERIKAQATYRGWVVALAVDEIIVAGNAMLRPVQSPTLVSGVVETVLEKHLTDLAATLVYPSSTEGPVEDARRAPAVLSVHREGDTLIIGLPDGAVTLTAAEIGFIQGHKQSCRSADSAPLFVHGLSDAFQFEALGWDAHESALVFVFDGDTDKHNEFTSELNHLVVHLPACVDRRARASIQQDVASLFGFESSWALDADSVEGWYVEESIGCEGTMRAVHLKTAVNSIARAAETASNASGVNLLRRTRSIGMQPTAGASIRMAATQKLARTLPETPDDTALVLMATTPEALPHGVFPVHVEVLCYRFCDGDF